MLLCLSPPTWGLRNLRLDCHLEQVPNPVTVLIWKCEDAAPIFYALQFNEVEVTGYRSECTASAYPTCSSSTTVQKCTEVEYDECYDTIEPVCFGCGDGPAGYACTFKIP